MAKTKRDHDLRWAFNADGVFVGIDNIPLEKRGKACSCICPKCKEQVIAKFGHDVPHGKRPHFAHMDGSKCHGAYMTALHILAEEILKKEKMVMFPEYKEIPAHIKSFIGIECETMNDRPDLRPDIVGIAEDGTRWHIEIRNTSEVKEPKINKIKDSKISCLEIDVRGHEDNNKDEFKDFLVNQSDNRNWINNPIFDKIISEKKERKENQLKELKSKYKEEDGYKIKTDRECYYCIKYKDDCAYKRDVASIDDQDYVICNDAQRTKERHALFEPNFGKLPDSYKDNMKR